uniref:Uncharacterized protein n=1 Tax=Rhizophora mucronata TaxID=61149 RepID=A0A2P2JDB7_RHIMU
MKHCVIQESAFSTGEEMTRSATASLSDLRDPVVCPKPRRLGILSAAAATDQHSARSLRLHLSSQQSESDDLDAILMKGGYGVEQSCPQVAGSPPFFCGSPPSRVANPLIQDARFGDEILSPFSPVIPSLPSLGLSSSPTSSTRKAGCVRANFGNKPAVRIEGFDCLDRDHRNCSIPALA